LIDEVPGTAEHLRNRRPVLATLEAAEKEVARRIIDFLSGTTYAMVGTTQKIGNGVSLREAVRDTPAGGTIEFDARLSGQVITLTSGEIVLGKSLAIDAGSREVTKDGRPLRLTAREFDLLWFLASNPRRVFSRDHLMARVWGYEAAMDTGTVTVHMRRLREKIEDDPSQPTHLETVWGVGYRFAP